MYLGISRFHAQGPEKLPDCSAVAFSSTAVFLTWKDSGKSHEMGNFSIHYRPLHSEGKFKVVHAGALSFRLIENLDVKTYYAFRIVTKDATGQTYHCETFARTMSDGNQTSCAVKGKLPVAHRMYVSVVVRKPGHNFEEGKLHSYPTKKALLPSQEEKPTKPTRASDRNECKEIPDQCYDRAQCINTKGSFFCRCPLGWTGDGKICKELSQDKRKRAFCNNESFLNINWPITSQGETALSWCPFGSRGLAKRQCLEVFGDNTSRWGLPDLSECVSDKMMDIARQLDDPDVDVTEISMQLVNATDITTYTQAPLHTGDLKLVVDLIEKISQKGLGTIQHLPPAIRDENIKQVTQVCHPRLTTFV
ncbi:uncharacterized protein LOC111321148 [Stylophora pistillata]|uniref:uncharacterized protein LOC111321148 n=1 Tax=Stylophora pistillata TaxID=50429 RepID=UPI000C0512CB|nr:uncharacterized protein LOC111321148 [Stylophora pistillata]